MDSLVVEDTSVVVEVAEAISRHGNRAVLPVWSIAEGADRWDSSILFVIDEKIITLNSKARN